ncbi:MAG: VWA domain-containing protein [Planctomycetes bacterium]|nr:VWA domain-containing protein [Planctomycetota bacterium]
MRLLLTMLATSCLLAAQGVDIHRAREGLETASKGKDEAAFVAALKAISTLKDVRVIDDLSVVAERLQRELDKLHAEIEKTGVALAEAWKNVDSQGSQGRPVTVGTAQAAEKKHVAIQTNLRKLNDQQDSTEARLRAIDEHLPIAMASLDQASRTTIATGLATKAARAKQEQRLQVVRVLAACAAMVPEAREALVELMATAEDPDARTAAIMGLGRSRDPALATAVAQALSDTAMNVRSAAARLLARLPSASGVAPLIASMEKSDGRVLEELVRALEDLTGRTYFDNAALWREWWAQDGARLSAAMDALGGDDFSKKGPAFEVIAAAGFCAGARLLLRQEGFDAASVVTAPAEGSPEAALGPVRRETVPKLLQRMPPRIRTRAAYELLLQPLREEKLVPQRFALSAMCAAVTDSAVAAMLAEAAGSNAMKLPDGSTLGKEDRAKLRDVAITGLGLQEAKYATPTLRELVDGDAEKPVKLLAVAALARLLDKATVDPLIRAAGVKDPEVVAAASKALRDISGEDKGDAAAWRLWWNTAQKDFQPRKPLIAPTEEAVRENKGTNFYGIESRSRRLMFVLDRSGSMSESDTASGSRWSVAQTEVINCIAALPDDAAFNIIFFSHDFDVWSKGLMPATRQNKATATAWIKGIEAVGATNIFDPLERAFSLAGRGTFDKAYGTAFDTIYLMSDGQPNRGRIIDPAEIVKELQRMNMLKLIKVHTIGVGKNHDPVLMRRIAEVTGGDYVAR